MHPCALAWPLVATQIEPGNESSRIFRRHESLVPTVNRDHAGRLCIADRFRDLLNDRHQVVGREHRLALGADGLQVAAAAFGLLLHLRRELVQWSGVSLYRLGGPFLGGRGRDQPLRKVVQQLLTLHNGKGTPVDGLQQDFSIGLQPFDPKGPAPPLKNHVLAQAKTSHRRPPLCGSIGSPGRGVHRGDSGAAPP